MYYGSQIMDIIRPFIALDANANGWRTDLRQAMALEIAARLRLTLAGGVWSVPSLSVGGCYRGVTWPGAESRTFEDVVTTNKQCKYILNARLVEERAGKRSAPPIDTDIPPKRKTYKQDWPKYDLARTTEKNRFQELLADLCLT